MVQPYPSERSLANLRPFNKMSDEERKRMNANGGRKAGETKKERKKCAEVMRLLVDKVYKDKKGSKADGREVLMVSLFNKAVKEADIPAMKLVLSLLDEMPVPQLSVRTDKEATDNGILDKLLAENLKIQKGLKDGKTGTKGSDADS